MLKRALFVTLAVVIAASCSTKGTDDPVKNAILEKVQAQTGKGTKLTFDNIQLIDSCTFAGEIDNRIHGFEIKAQQDSLFQVKYHGMGQFKKSQEKINALSRDRKYISTLEGIRESLGDKAKDIAYYDYVFTARGKTADGAQVMMKEYYLCITPDGKVLSMVDDKKTLHKGTGVVIPGYSEMFGNNEDPESKAE